MPLGLVRNRSLMRRGRRLVTKGAAPTTGCVCCAGPCAIPCAMTSIAPGTTDALGYLTAYAACPDCIPATVRMTVTGLVRTSLDMIPMRAGATYAGGGAAPVAAFFKPISGIPKSFDVCLGNFGPLGSPFPGVAFLTGWGQFNLPLLVPLVGEVWVDPFPPIDDEGCLVYDPGRAVKVCTVTATRYNASFHIAPGGVGTLGTGYGHDFAGFEISACFNIPPEDFDECITTFPNPSPSPPPGAETVTVYPLAHMYGFLFLRTPPPVHALDGAFFPPTEVFDFCGDAFTFQGSTETEWRDANAALFVECPDQIDVVMNNITWGGTVRVKPCCVLKTPELCNGDAVGTETWYQGRDCKGALVPILAAPHWVDLDSGEAYFDGSIYRCITFSSADSKEVIRGQFPWNEGFQPFYAPMATVESCSVSPCAEDPGPCPAPGEQELVDGDLIIDAACNGSLAIPLPSSVTVFPVTEPNADGILWQGIVTGDCNDASGNPAPDGCSYVFNVICETTYDEETGNPISSQWRLDIEFYTPAGGPFVTWSRYKARTPENENNPFDGEDWFAPPGDPCPGVTG